MAKRVHKNDSTMDVSLSQLVVEPPPRRQVANPANDASVWKQVVVGTDDFAPAPSARKSGRGWIIFAVAGLMVAAAGGYAFLALRGDDSAPVAASVPEPTASAPAAAPSSEPPPTPAPAASVEVPAAAAAVPPLVAVPAAEPALITADAISGVGAPLKEKRKKVATKKPTKKKPVAPAPKRK